MFSHKKKVLDKHHSRAMKLGLHKLLTNASALSLYPPSIQTEILRILKSLTPQEPISLSESAEQLTQDLSACRMLDSLESMKSVRLKKQAREQRLEHIVRTYPLKVSLAILKGEMGKSTWPTSSTISQLESYQVQPSKKPSKTSIEALRNLNLKTALNICNPNALLIHDAKNTLSLTLPTALIYEKPVVVTQEITVEDTDWMPAHARNAINFFTSLVSAPPKKEEPKKLSDEEILERRRRICKAGVPLLSKGDDLAIHYLSAIEKNYTLLLKHALSLINISSHTAKPATMEKSIVDYLMSHDLNTPEDLLKLKDDLAFVSTFSDSQLKDIEDPKACILWLFQVWQIYKLREVISSVFTIGVVGTMKTGKSSLLQTWNLDCPASATVHTLDTGAYFFADDNDLAIESIRVLDFPGCNDIDSEVSNGLNRYRCIADAIICVTEADKADSSDLIKTLDTLPRDKPVLLCLNKADLMMQVEKPDSYEYTSFYTRALLAAAQIKEPEQPEWKTAQQMQKHMDYVLDRIAITKEFKNFKCMFTIFDEERAEMSPDKILHAKAANIKFSTDVMEWVIKQSKKDPHIRFDEAKLRQALLGEERAQYQHK